MKRAMLTAFLLSALALLYQAPSLAPVARPVSQVDPEWMEPEDRDPSTAQAEDPRVEIEPIGPSEPLRRMAGSF